MQSNDAPQSTAFTKTRALLLGLTLMLSGRAMTLAFLPRVGAGGPMDPPAAWLMPLTGDAIIGVSALAVAALLLRGRGLATWTFAVTWNVVALWDALSAYLVSINTPWPSFFMLELFGPAMFFIAATMHGICVALLCRRVVRERYLGAAAA